MNIDDYFFSFEHSPVRNSQVSRLEEPFTITDTLGRRIASLLQTSQVLAEIAGWLG